MTEDDLAALPPVLRAKQLMAITGERPSTFYRHAAEGKLPFPVFKIGSSIRAWREDVITWKRKVQAGRELVDA